MIGPRLALIFKGLRPSAGYLQTSASPRLALIFKGLRHGNDHRVVTIDES